MSAQTLTESTKDEIRPTKEAKGPTKEDIEAQYESRGMVPVAWNRKYSQMTGRMMPVSVQLHSSSRKRKPYKKDWPNPPTFLIVRQLQLSDGVEGGSGGNDSLQDTLQTALQRPGVFREWTRAVDHKTCSACHKEAEPHLTTAVLELYLNQVRNLARRIREAHASKHITHDDASRLTEALTKSVHRARTSHPSSASSKGRTSSKGGQKWHKWANGIFDDLVALVNEFNFQLCKYDI